MKVQSLSIVVPTKTCVNNCAFCVSRMKNDEYKNQMDDNKPFYDLYLKDYLKRLEFARDNGTNTVMLTGNAEPQQNRNFLTYFGLFMMLLEHPFRNIEMQTTGIMIDEPYLRFLRNHVGVNTLSLSLSALDDNVNKIYNGTRDDLAIIINDFCDKIKKYDFNLRLSLNLTDYYNDLSVEEIFETCKSLNADQVTFRVLYMSEEQTKQNDWIKEHGASIHKIKEIEEYIRHNGKSLERLEFGRIKYSVHGMSVVLDDDCMNTEAKEELKYLILRPDCKLYSKWDDKASLIF